MENTTLTKKLLKIQQEIKTFAQTEESEKKVTGKPGKSAYQYTPGYLIVETIREQMDKMGIILESTLVEENHQMITYPVYKEIGREIKQFTKTEMYVTIKMAFTWVDAETGEQRGPFVYPGAGANGTDKSMASAISLCERYFLLKYFKITTREKDDEPDAHDSSQLPGGMANYPDAKDYTAGSGYAPALNTYPGPAPALHPVHQPMQQYQQYQGYVPPQNNNITKENVYENAVNAIAQFEVNTKSHTDVVNAWMVMLKMNGIDTSAVNFTQKLIEDAQARREGRLPRF